MRYTDSDRKWELWSVFHIGGIMGMIDKLTIAGSEVSVEIIPSATRHGQSKEDILRALEWSIYDETLETDPNKTLSIGYDRNARLLEVVFHVLSDEHIVVFHAMPCRKHYIERMLR
jgi:hypothetical protein